LFLGKDGSTEFDDVGHSNEAIDTMKTFYVGDLEGAGKKATETKQETPKDTQVQNQAGGGRAQRLLIPLVILLLALFIRYALINFVL
jgi:cytochrome b involved in lipid metabolism